LLSSQKIIEAVPLSSHLPLKQLMEQILSSSTQECMLQWNRERSKKSEKKETRRREEEEEERERREENTKVD
jgi:hypothetical protein